VATIDEGIIACNGINIRYLNRLSAWEMMMITKQSKLLFLFFSRENRLFEKLLSKSPTQSEISAKTGLNQSTLSNWRRGGEIDRRTVLKAFDFLKRKINTDAPEQHRRELLYTLDRFIDVYVSVGAQHSNLRIYDIATDILGMNIEQCQKIIDEVIYDKHTIFPGICYDSATEASTAFEVLGGNYHLWVRRQLVGEAIWLKCPLRARYVLNLKNGTVLRCKLNAPVIHRDEFRIVTHWEYDGFCRERDNRVYWMFEKRIILGSDFFYFITGKPFDYTIRRRSRKTLVGTYLSTGQDAARSIVADRVILQRLSIRDIERELPPVGTSLLAEQSDDAQKIRRWMSHAPMCVRSGDADYDYARELDEQISEAASIESANH
jgi:transcriptional regulator with XRE-family HTH domain